MSRHKFGYRVQCHPKFMPNYFSTNWICKETHREEIELLMDTFLIIFGFFKNQYTILQQLNDPTYILRWDSNSQPPRLETSRITSTRVIPSWFNSNLLEQHFLIEVGSDAC